jgi:hypothetical protein
MCDSTCEFIPEKHSDDIYEQCKGYLSNCHIAIYESGELGPNEINIGK